MTTSRTKRATTGGAPPSWRRLVLLLVGVLVLVLPATMALASNSTSEDRRSDQAEKADEGAGGDNSHCEDEESGPGHSDCKPDNNPKPDNPPCDADHGHPGDNAKQCQEGPENPGSCDDGIDNDGDGDTDGDDSDCVEEPCDDADDDGVCDEDDTEGPPGDPSCEDGFDNDGDGDTDGDDSDCVEEPCDDADDDGICDEDDTEGPPGDPSCEDGFDNDGDGATDGDDTDCQGGPPENLCTAAADDPGLPLTEDTLGQTLWDSGLDALDPLTEDPERNGPLSGAIGDAGTDTPLEPVTDEVACAVDLLINESTGADL